MSSLRVFTKMYADESKELRDLVEKNLEGLTASIQATKAAHRAAAQAAQEAFRASPLGEFLSDLDARNALSPPLSQNSVDSKRSNSPRR